MAADVELLPCPFCGAGKTEIRENGRPWLGQRYGEPVSVSVRHWCEPIEGQPVRMIERVGRDRAAAVAAWNRRAAARGAEIEALRAEVDRLHEQLRLATVDQVNAEAEANDARSENERLAKALRELVEVFSESGMYDEEVFDKARAALAKESSND